MVRFPESCWAAGVAGIAAGGLLLLGMRLLAGGAHPLVDSPRDPRIPAPLAGGAQAYVAPAPRVESGASWPCSPPARLLQADASSTAALDWRTAPPLELVALQLPERQP